MAGKAALVVGGSTGVGRATAEMLPRKGRGRGRGAGDGRCPQHGKLRDAASALRCATGRAPDVAVCDAGGPDLELAPDGIGVDSVSPGRAMAPRAVARAEQMAAAEGVPVEAIYGRVARDIPLRRYGTAEKKDTNRPHGTDHRHEPHPRPRPRQPRPGS